MLRRAALVSCAALIADGPITIAAETSTDEDARAAVAAAACSVRGPRRDIKRLKAPHDGVYEVRCADGFII